MEYLSKVLKIDRKSADSKKDIAAQRRDRSEDPIVRRENNTNDRMLRCNRLDNYFFMGTLFATKKVTKSVRGYTCCQIFVTDGSFAHVEPLRK